MIKSAMMAPLFEQTKAIIVDRGELQVVANLIQLKTYCVTMYSASGVDKKTYRMLQSKAELIDKILIEIVSGLKNLNGLGANFYRDEKSYKEYNLNE